MDKGKRDFRFQNEDLKKEAFTPLEKVTEPLSIVGREHSSLTGFTQSKIQDPKSEIPDLPGIDIETGISRVGGKKRIFLKLLMEFGDQYNNAENEIRNLLKDEDLDTARRLAHTIKGVSGTLGAMELYTSASELESAIEKERKETFPALLEKFTETIHLVLESIKLLKKGISEEKTTPADPVQLEIEKVKPLLNELSYLIKQNSMDAENCLEKLNKHLNGHRVSDNLKKLEDSINNLEYETAGSILIEVVKSLDISLEGKGAGNRYV